MGKSFRLPNSFGSVYKLSGNRRRPYAIAKTFGWDDQGKQIKKIIGYAETKKEGLERLFEFNKNPLTNIDLLNLTCKEAFENWIEFTSKNDEISKSNLSSYNSVFINHCKEIYKIPILKIKTLDFQHCIDSCQKGYTTRKYIKLIASKLYYYCSVQLDMPILKNFSDGLKIGNKEISDKHQPFTFEEINLLWKNIEVPYVDSDYYIYRFKTN